MMRKALLAAVFSLSTMINPLAVQAESKGDGGRVTLGFGRLFNNDYIGDGHDRWRTASYALSMLRGPEWDGALPSAFGQVLEFRLRTEMISARNISKPSPKDRRYVGALSLGLHTHFALAGAEARLGADLVATGPQTKMGKLQRELHKVLGGKRPDLSNQISNHVYPTVSAELGKSYSIGERARLRPFAEAQAGVEDFMRVGGDLMIGSIDRGSLMLRDVVTGQRYIGVRGDEPSLLSFAIGGDVAHVFKSKYLPSGGAAKLKHTRSRLRAGMHWQTPLAEIFYGVTYLGKEFEGQGTGQTVGSLNVRLQF